MHIRKLELHGFKSFPERTTFHFGPGISGVVGPNGCGKSNIVDAIKWCLGEQSAKSLRGQNMGDVIFAGSTSRNPSGAAEVTIHFEAGDEPFPGEWQQHPELAITRRLHRDGNSEYRINQQKVRLRDVQDLFLDSGAGNRLYSFIEQGRIGEIVNARPEQRRTLIEEAAGISRYKVRRKEAEVKLSETLDNLERVSDQVGTLERSMRKLERQVGKAMKHRRLKSYIRQGDVVVGLARYAGLAGDRRALAGQLRQAEALEAELTLDVQRRGAAQKDARENADVLEVRSSEIRDELAEVEASRREREQVKTFQIRERGELGDRITLLERRGVQASSERDAAAARLAEVERERAEVQSRLAGVESDLESARSEVRTAESAVRERRRRIESAKSAVLDRAKSLARARAELHAGEMRRGDLDARQARLQRLRATRAQEARELATAMGDAEVARAAADASAATAGETAQAAREALTEAQVAHQAARERARERRGALVTLERDAARATARVDALAALVEGEDGAEGALKAALRVDGVRGRLGNLLDVPASLEAGVAVALRELLDAVVVPDAAVAAAVAAAVDGRVDIVVGGGGDLPPSLRAVGGDPLAVGAVARLLAGCQTAADVTSALATQARTGGPVIVTTATPAFVDARGVLRVGPPGGGAALLARRRELGDARAHQVEVEAALTAARGAFEASAAQEAEREAAVAGARDALGVALEAARDAEQSRKDASRELAALQHRQSRDQQQAARADEEAAEIKAGREGLAAREAALNEQIRRDEAEQDRVETALKGEQAALGDEGRELGRVREGLSTRAAEAAALRERLVGLDRTRAEVQSACAGAARQVDESAAEIEAAHARIADLTSADGEIEVVIEALKTKEADLGTRLADLREQLRARREALSAAEDELNEARARREGATARRNELDRETARVKDELARIRTDLQERYAVSVVGLLDKVERNGSVVLEADAGAVGDDLPEIAKPSEEDAVLVKDVRVTPAAIEDPEVLAHWEAEVARARAALEALGEVNLVALQEYGEVSAEHAELDAQRVDLDTSVADIRQTIARLNRISRERFRDTFERVDAHFREIYPRLVGGGQARLQLTDEEDMLDTGVDIYVQPPGKRLQNLTLLSGGETAMVAIALIFSLFRVKPSPFCLLDEVDAPLDEGNGARFNGMLREMAELSQFILVTHNKKTMEAADTLYGVTMPTPGVSRLVSVRLD